MKPLVYDLGMNQGRNIPYYLAKGCRVVAVEAAPDLVARVRDRFAAQLQTHDLVVVNAGIADKSGSQPFYVNHTDTVHSSFVRPSNYDENWSTIEVATVPLTDLINRYGDPYFVKIDIEHYDLLVLRDLLSEGLRPPRISAEAHSIDIICALVTMGYEEFQFLNGREVGRSIARRQIQRIDGGVVPFLFPKHAAGPFDDDLDGTWMNSEVAMQQWLARRETFGRGWLDVHARG